MKSLGPWWRWLTTGLATPTTPSFGGQYFRLLTYLITYVRWILSWSLMRRSWKHQVLDQTPVVQAWNPCTWEENWWPRFQQTLFQWGRTRLSEDWTPHHTYSSCKGILRNSWTLMLFARGMMERSCPWDCYPVLEGRKIYAPQPLRHWL